jgi:uncharacterized phiE125 gp8 family phage protein
MTLDQVREELREKSNANDAVIERRINALSYTFEQRTGWVLMEQTLEGYRVSGNGRRVMHLPLIPVQSVTKIEMRDMLDDSVVQTITDTSKFLLKDIDRFGRSLDGQLQLLEDTFRCGELNILIDMVVGFPKSDPKAAEAQRLFMMQLSYEYRRWLNGEAGVISRSMSDGSISFAPPQNLLREVEDGLMGMKSGRL